MILLHYWRFPPKVRSAILPNFKSLSEDLKSVVMFEPLVVFTYFESMLTALCGSVDELSKGVVPSIGYGRSFRNVGLMLF